MRASFFACAVAFAFTATTAAYNVTIYDTKDCTGGKSKVLGEFNVEKGCQKIEGDIKGSIKIQWSGDADNAFSFSTYKGDKCCTAYYDSTLIWQDECMELGKVRSFRVISPEDIAKGKKDENYQCTDKPAEL
ncbi:hypothetical protein GQ44DRAFT_723397 [Phaeosphaeriaceae sp. PMI808]|nr:hypothetical protein GQ44DRAFT_723397 [Phaeosphaeriaceae sp. PMI808]